MDNTVAMTTGASVKRIRTLTLLILLSTVLFALLVDALATRIEAVIAVDGVVRYNLGLGGEMINVIRMNEQSVFSKIPNHLWSV
jgi:hypothetical protein